MMNSFPKALLSSKYHNETSKNWCLIKMSLSRRKSWFPESFKGKVFLHREIIYLDENSYIIGIGKSWLKVRDIMMTLKMINPFHPKPLGIILEDCSDKKDICIEVLEKVKFHNYIVPYRINVIKGYKFKRRITIESYEFECVVEEVIEDTALRIDA